MRQSIELEMKCEWIEVPHLHIISQLFLSCLFSRLGNRPSSVFFPIPSEQAVVFLDNQIWMALRFLSDQLFFSPFLEMSGMWTWICLQGESYLSTLSQGTLSNRRRGITASAVWRPEPSEASSTNQMVTAYLVGTFRGLWIILPCYRTLTSESSWRKKRLVFSANWIS